MTPKQLVATFVDRHPVFTLVAPFCALFLLFSAIVTGMWKTYAGIALAYFLFWLAVIYVGPHIERAAFRLWDWARTNRVTGEDKKD
jgi:hypothetical protein